MNIKGDMKDFGGYLTLSLKYENHSPQLYYIKLQGRIFSMIAKPICDLFHKMRTFKLWPRIIAQTVPSENY